LTEHRSIGGWRITTSEPDGSCTWTSPHGRTYQHEPTTMQPEGPPPGEIDVGPIHGPPPF
jgi:hypothetical protein